MPHTLLVPINAPCRLSASMEILTAWTTHSLVIPHLCMLLAIIIRGDFPMIPFLISTDVFLFSGATEKIELSHTW
jgi:hypothetical protein